MYILFALYNHNKDIFFPLSNISGNPGPLARCYCIRRQKGHTKPIKPTQHRQFLAGKNNGKIRNFVVAQESNSLTKHFDDCLKGLFDFRSLHFTMVNDYVASKAENPLGTGGTDFMQWLQKLTDETACNTSNLNCGDINASANHGSRRCLGLGECTRCG